MAAYRRRVREGLCLEATTPSGDVVRLTVEPRTFWPATGRARTLSFRLEGMAFVTLVHRGRTETEAADRRKAGSPLTTMEN